MKKRIFAALVAFAVLGVFSLQAQVKKKVSSKTAVTKKVAVAAEVATCDIGEKGIGGGTVFFENTNYKTDGWRYLEAYWSDSSIGVKYSDGTKFLNDINAGKVKDLQAVKKSDWYVPSKSELSSLVSAVGYPKGLLPPGRYFVNGGNEFVSFDYDLKTKKQTLNKMPARFNAIKLKQPAKALKGASLAKFQKDLDKRSKLEEKRKSLNVGNFVVVRKITVAELSRPAPKFRFAKGGTFSRKDPKQRASEEKLETTSEVTYLPNGDGSAITDYSAIDNYVLTVEIPDSMSIADAAKKICQTARSDIEKARAIFAWIGYNITYDSDSLNIASSEEQHEIGIYNGEKTFERRMGVCAGYSALFKLMAEALGLQDVKYISGYSKQSSTRYNDELGGLHAWNSVKCGNKTVLLDSTWGAAYSQNGSGAPVLKETWFDCDPELFVLSHFPLKNGAPAPNGDIGTAKPFTPVPEDQYLSKPINTEIFQVTPYVTPIFAKAGVSNNMNFLKNHPKAWTVKTYTNFDSDLKTGLRLNRFEFSNELVVGQKVKFNFEIPQGKMLYAKFNGTQRIDFENSKDIEVCFEEPGQVVFYYGIPGQTCYGIISYDVVAARSAPHEQAMKNAFANY